MTTRFFEYHGKPFLKYALVGITGTLIDVGLFTWLVTILPSGETIRGHVIAATMSFVFAVTNNYVWNSRWTFKEYARRDRRQFLQFLMVSCVGWALNTFAVTLFSSIALQMFGSLRPMVSAGAKICASGVVLMYNFIVNRYWTFRRTM